MIKGELRKLLQRMPTRIILLVLFLTNALIVWNQPIPGTVQYYDIDATHIRSLYAALPQDAHQAVATLQQQYDALRNAIFSDESIGTMLTSDIYTETKLFSNVLQRVEPAAHYSSMLKEIDDNAETLMASGFYAKQSFGYRNILKTQEKYRSLQGVVPKVFYSGAVELLPGDRITDLLLLLFCLLVGLEMVAAERINGTMALIKPTVKGSGTLITAKIFSGLFAIFFGTCILYGTNLLIGVIRCGAVPMDAPIQSVYGFARSSWNVSIGMYIAAFLIVKFLWAAAVLAIAYLACCLGKSIFACSAVFLLFVSPSILMRGSVISLFYTGDTAHLFAEYQNLNVFGYPISAFVACIAALFFLSSVCFTATKILHIRSIALAPERRIKKRHKASRTSTSLFVHEGRKLFFINGGIWVLLGVLVIQSVTYLNFDAYISPKEKMYIQYSEKLSGQATQEKDAFLEQETERFAQLYVQMDEYATAFSEGMLRQETYEALVSGIKQELEGEEIFLRAKNQYEQMKRQGCDYVCQTGYERLLGEKGQQEMIALTVKLLIALILGLASIHSAEYESDVILLLHTVVRKRASEKTKLLLTILYASVAVMIAYAPYLLALGNAYDFSGLSADAKSVPLLKIGTSTVVGSLTVYAVGILCAALLTALLIAWISKKSKSTIAAMMLSAFLLIPVACMWLF